MTSLEMAHHLLQVAHEVHDSTGQFITQARKREVSQCILVRERSSHSLRPFTETAVAQGQLLVEAAADHLNAFTRLLATPVQTFAPFTCVRGTLEASALAAWLFDPALDALARVTNSVALRYQGLEQQLRFVKAVGSRKQVETAQGRIEYLESEAKKLGLQQVTDAKGNRVGIGRRMPKVTELIGETLGMVEEYRLLSAVTHGHHWATQQLAFTRVDSSSGVALAKDISAIAVTYLCRTAIKSFGSAILREAQLSGWDVGRLSHLICSGFTAAGVDLALS
jgi:hypothetical protein